MSMVNEVQNRMIAAMKAKDIDGKVVYSNLLAALKKREIDLRGSGKAMTDADAISVVQREVKDNNDFIESVSMSLENAKKSLDAEYSAAIADKIKSLEDAIAIRVSQNKILSEFLPKQMSRDEVLSEIKTVIAELGIEVPTAKNTGAIMKSLMPRVKGKVDGKTVSSVLTEFLGGAR